MGTDGLGKKHALDCIFEIQTIVRFLRTPLKKQIKGCFSEIQTKSCGLDVQHRHDKEGH
jgi:hypothetical protein